MNLRSQDYLYPLAPPEGDDGKARTRHAAAGRVAASSVRRILIRVCEARSPEDGIGGRRPNYLQTARVET